MTRTARAVALAVAAALSAGLTAAVAPAATAVEAVPWFSYLSIAGADQYRVFANTADGSGTPTALTPTSYVYGYDVSQDGSVLAAAVSTRPPDAPYMDTSFGLVVSRSGSTQVLSTMWDTNPVVSADGRTIWWLAQGSIYRSVDGGAPVEVSGKFGMVDAEGYPTSLAISPDGLNAAVFFTGDTSVTVFAAHLAAGGATFSKTYSFSSAPFADDSTFVWKDNSTLLFNLADDSGPSAVVAANLGVTTTTDTGLGAVYGLRPLGSTWYMWRDTDTTSEYGATADLSTAPTTWVPRTDGMATADYIPSSAVPGAITTATNRDTPTVTFAVGSPVLWGKRAPYLSFVEYLTPLPEQTSYDAWWNFRGTLQYSTNAGATWTYLRTTSGVTLVDFPAAKYGFGNGYTQVLKRNTWFRWIYPGDLLTKPASSIRKVVVTPIVTVKVATSSSGSRKVYGTVTRIGGTALLYRYSSGSWIKVASTTITSSGAYSFGYRTLRRGTYKVVAPATTYYGSAYKKFTI